MTKSIFLEKSYIAASIIYFKNKFFQKKYTTYEELNYISNRFQQIFNNEGYDVVIIDSIDTDYFEISTVVSVNQLNNFSLVSRFQGYVDINVLSIIWNEEIIYDLLYDFKLKEITEMKNKKELIKKLVVNK